MRTPRTNLRTCQPKVASRVKNRTTFSACSTSWFFRCFLAVIFLRTESRAPCRRELRKGESKRNLRWQKPRSACFCLVSRNLLRARQTSSPASCISYSPGSRVEPEFCFREHGETCARHGPELSNEFSRVAKRWQSVLVYGETRAGWCVWAFREYKETCARCWEPTRKDKVGLPHYANLRQSILWKSLQECSTEVESSWGWSFDGSNSQCIDLGIIYVNNNESISSSSVKIQCEFGCVQEHHFRWARDVVRHYAVVDLGTCIRDSECFHDWMEILSLDISIFSSASCPETMSKKMQQGTGQERDLWQNQSRRWTWSLVLRQAVPQRRVRVQGQIS